MVSGDHTVSTTLLLSGSGVFFCPFSRTDQSFNRNWSFGEYAKLSTSIMEYLYFDLKGRMSMLGIAGALLIAIGAFLLAKWIKES